AIKASRVLETERESIAQIFKINPKHLSFLPSRETAVLNSLFSISSNKENNLIMSVLEDHSLIGPAMKFSELTGSNINYLSMNDELNLLDTLQERISKDSSIFLFSALTLGMGIKRNWESISKLCEDNNVRTVMDMSYLVGHETIDFSKVMPDVVLSSSTNGALGPQSIAFQFVSEEINDEMKPLLVGGGSIVSLSRSNYKLSNWSHKFETGTINISAVVGLSRSLQLLNDIGLELIHNHEKKLRRQLVQGLENIQNIELVNLDGIENGPILSFRSESVDSHDIAIILEDIQNIFVRSGALCSHLFIDELGQNSLVQLSTHIYNTEEQIITFIDTLKSIMEEI
ncbi:MAG: aminotransferase class V-fold PLP-dependent enzyme, partial [Candidatus Heimdallarchaeota archaeon]|nr:aminotransferase class V-fold PLP-dependent enzyme [Candidatus Heimdallarchaeota archaeon]